MTDLLQLGKAELIRVCNGKAPSIDSVIQLGTFLMDKLSVKSEVGGVVDSVAVDGHGVGGAVADLVGCILNYVVDSGELAEEQLEELKTMLSNYKTVVAPALIVAIDAAAAVSAAAAAPQGTRWKTVLSGLLTSVMSCMKIVAAARPSVAAPAPAPAPVPAPAPAAAAPVHEDLVLDTRLIMDPKAPSPPDAPTPPPTPDESHSDERIE
jgi:hypothetical protein